jgi:hypothetical protein
MHGRLFTIRHEEMKKKMTIRKTENAVCSIFFIIYSIRLDLLLCIQDQDQNNPMLKKRVCIAGDVKKRRILGPLG